MWDVNEVVFSNDMWSGYEGLMRSDFTWFDEYEYTRAGEDPFDFPITCFWGTEDKKVKEYFVKGWEKFTTGAFTQHR